MDYKEKFIMYAIKAFDGTGKYFGVFNTAGYQSAIKYHFGYVPSRNIVKKHLKNQSRILQLSGGCHWKYS